MSTPDIRKLVIRVEETHAEAGSSRSAPTRKAAAAAVIANPFANRSVEDLEPLFAIGEQLGALLGARAVEALGIEPGEVESYGKAVLVGTDGELEHAAASCTRGSARGCAR